MLIEYFSIKKLFGYQDFKINFKNKDTIFVGENGMGKTTILSILYHTLSLNFYELLDYDFELIELKYKGVSTFSLNYKDIELFSRSTRDPNRRLPEGFIKKVEETIDYNNLDIDDMDKFDKHADLIRIELYKDNIRVSQNMLREAMRYVYQNNAGNLKEFIAITKKFLNEYKILYFPTYRRIEEDIYNINNDEGAFYEDTESQHYYDPSINRKRKTKKIGELIQFGMKDVQKTLDELLDTIKKTSIESFNKMTGELLYQYVENDLEGSINIDDLTEDEILISLSRVGTEIKTDLQDKIVDMFKSNSLEKNIYLTNFIINLVAKNHSLEPIDNKIQQFVDICNSYLYGKQFIYDPSAVTLEIKTTNQDRIIPLSKLSSGEKQIISTFSKIYLKNDDHLLILFDEPELSLSIAWQKKFIYDITQANNCRFSISVTHSAHIFNKLMDNATELNKYLRVVD
ncbi:AAA family ATPase [Carnobacterium maltaromaticum]|uniref:AAA family ATPase n=1 Tax=Carnobacterium maltaromaticum TaxID=2751 RepID=UPI00191BB3DA|nr:AAA family ATPase [Carnobacterium maltaromaticum]CAD5900070.1 conserved hypothetical protein [Carnobacterium maltaromaticum]